MITLSKIGSESRNDVYSNHRRTDNKSPYGCQTMVKSSFVENFETKCN
jgi:hypothetical protein